MKTCSFRGAQPRSINEGLFCGEDEPKAKYKMVPCGNLFCQCCHPINNYKKNETWPVVDFANSSKHEFVNGYTTYLNCPAVSFSLFLGVCCFPVERLNSILLNFRLVLHQISSML